ncbi:hypothetical protein [Streptomyces olivaceoviridis]|uniref:hypothetical protein n=1 Tax=Streptomyces olivaceoviridis TaxID=1921 RepID=UPI0036FA2DEE
MSMAEGRRLQRISRTSKDPVRLRRAIVVLMSAQGQPVGDITSLLPVGEDIESEFAALRYFALNGTDHRTHGEQNAAVAAYIRWRNARAEPKTGFAPESPIRHGTEYPAKAA